MTLREALEALEGAAFDVSVVAKLRSYPADLITFAEMVSKKATEHLDALEMEDA